MPCWVDVYIGDSSRGQIGELRMGQIGTCIMGQIGSIKEIRPEYKLAN